MSGQSSPGLTPILEQINFFWLDVQRQKWGLLQNKQNNNDNNNNNKKPHKHHRNKFLFFSLMRSEPTHRNMSIEHTLGDECTIFHIHSSSPRHHISCLDNYNNCLLELLVPTFAMTIHSPKSLQILSPPCKNLVMTFYCF